MKYGPSEAEISARRLLAYAAGLGETGDLVFDDAREGGIVGLPPFCVSLEWPLVRARADGNRLGVTFEEALRGVHAIQDSIFHRPIRPGDRLITESVVVEVRPTRAGAFTRVKLETRAAASGEPVVTSWCASIFRGVEVEGEPQRLESPPPLPDGQLDPSSCESIEIPIGREAPHVYTECADIWNPIHTERQVALAAGLPDVILHGTATWALAACEIIRRRAGGDPTRLRRLHGRFTGMVIPGTSITVRLDTGPDDTVIFDVLNAEGLSAISQGVAELGDPPRG
jgi:acyl dehydratase